MLSSGLHSPFSYTRLRKDGLLIIYKAGIEGRIRDVHWGEEQRRDEIRRREGRKDDMGAGEKINSPKTDESRMTQGRHKLETL